MELISIVDCGLCVTLPSDQHVPDWELPLPETWGRLETILTRRAWDEPWSSDLARSASSLDVEELRVCRACGTYYHYRQDHEPHFGEPREPETDWYLRRLTPTEARIYYLTQTLPTGALEYLDGGWLEQRYETIISLLRRNLPRAPDWQIERHIIDSLYLHYIDAQDWEGLKASLIDYPNQAVGVYVVDRIFSALDPKNPMRGLTSSSFKYWDKVSALLGAEPTRGPFLVAVLAKGLSAPGQIMKYFYLTGWEPVSVAGYALSVLRTYAPYQNLDPAIPALAHELQQTNVERQWLREKVRDFLIEYVGAIPERAKTVLAALVSATNEALAVRTHCQKCLTPNE